MNKFATNGYMGVRRQRQPRSVKPAVSAWTEEAAPLCGKLGRDDAMDCDRLRWRGGGDAWTFLAARQGRVWNRFPFPSSNVQRQETRALSLRKFPANLPIFWRLQSQLRTKPH